MYYDAHDATMMLTMLMIMFSLRYMMLTMKLVIMRLRAMYLI